MDSDNKNQIIESFNSATLEARRNVYAEVIKGFGSISNAIKHHQAHEEMLKAHKEAEAKKADSAAESFEQFLMAANDQPKASAAMAWQEFEYSNPAGAVSVEALRYAQYVMTFNEIKVAPKNNKPGM